MIRFIGFPARLDFGDRDLMFVPGIPAEYANNRMSQRLRHQKYNFQTPQISVNH